jgi:hypothetical protein
MSSTPWRPKPNFVQGVSILIAFTTDRISSSTDLISERQYKSRIGKWGLDKNIKPKEMMHIVRKRQRRKLIEKDKPEYRFRVNNIEVSPAKISRWMQDHDVPEDAMYASSLQACTWTRAGQL